MGTKMVGLSLSFCIADILRGKVDKRDVVKIVAGTKCPDMGTFEQVLAAYEPLYWSGDGRGSIIARQFWAMGKIDQPRLRGQEPGNISCGHWMGGDITKGE